MKTIVCPNCGANATNLENCEYCGSLLVRFADKGIKYDEDIYEDSNIMDTDLADCLNVHLMTAKQPGIGGVCTHISHNSCDNIALQEGTICYVMNGAYLSNFSFWLIDPFAQKEAREWNVSGDAYFVMKTRYPDRESDIPSYQALKRYDLKIPNYSGKTFILVKPFINFSDDPDVNATRWDKSTDLIKSSQRSKMKLLRKDFSKLSSLTVIRTRDYNIELCILDCGEDVQGAASIIAQMDDFVLRHSVESYMETISITPPIPEHISLSSSHIDNKGSLNQTGASEPLKEKQLDPSMSSIDRECIANSNTEISAKASNNSIITDNKFNKNVVMILAAAVCFLIGVVLLILLR